LLAAGFGHWKDSHSQAESLKDGNGAARDGRSYRAEMAGGRSVVRHPIFWNSIQILVDENSRTNRRFAVNLHYDCRFEKTSVVGISFATTMGDSTDCGRNPVRNELSGGSEWQLR